MELNETRLSGETIFEGKVFTVQRDRIRLPDGREAEREVIRHPGGVGVLALDEENHIIMVRQYRYAAGEILLEIPAGRLEPGEQPCETGKRELREETGFRAGRFEPLGEIIPTGGYDSEIIWLFLARDLSPGDTCFDDGEFVETVRIPFEKALRDVMSGKIRDGKTAFAILKAHVMLASEKTGCEFYMKNA